MILLQIIYTLSCIPFAYLNKVWIDKGNRILHGWNGLLHLTVAACGWIFFGWEVFFIILCNARIVFDLSLNYFRKLPLDYVSKSPKSLVDRFEKWIFKEDGWSPKLVYLVASIILNILYF